MKINIGIIGYGNLGKAVEQTILSRNDCNLVAIFSRRTIKSKFNTIVDSLENLAQYVGKIDIMLLCGGSFGDLEKQTTDAILNFDCINTFDNHKKIVSELDRLNILARQSKHILIMSSGWDPGIFSCVRAMCYSLSKTKPDVFWGKGISMGHSEAIRKTDHVYDGLEFTIPNTLAMKLAKQGKLNENECFHFRQCYVVADKKFHKTITERILNIPDYFKGQPTKIDFISQSELINLRSKLSHKGEIISKFETVHGSKCLIDFKLKMDSNPNLTATIMSSFIDAVINLREKNYFGAFSPLDIPAIFLFKKGMRKKIIETLC